MSKRMPAGLIYNDLGDVDVVRILEESTNGYIVSTMFNSHFKYFPEGETEHIEVKPDEITLFGREKHDPIDFIYCVLHDETIYTYGYLDRNDPYPKTENLPTYGSGLKGIKTDYVFPKAVEISIGRYLYLKDDRAIALFRSVSKKMTLYLHYLMSHGYHDDDKLKSLVAGWNILFHLDEKPGDKDKPMSIDLLIFIFDSWLYLYNNPDVPISAEWEGFGNFPNDKLPSPITVVMFYQDYNSIVDYNRIGTIYPPYTSEVEYITI